MDMGQFQKRLSNTLLAWAGLSIAIGALLARGSAVRRGAGEQFVGWGLVNAAISLFARRTPTAERQTLSRLLWLNAGLDVLYVWGGWRTIHGRGQGDARWRGRGIGIVLQGGFLFLFDLVNALLLRGIRP